MIVGKAVNNDITAAVKGGRPVSSAGQCLTDTFSVTVPGGNAPPVICGTNNNQHLYVDASGMECNDLVFQIGGETVGMAAQVNRQWTIKATQFSCDFDNLAPQGCDQFFFGANMGTVQSFNYNGGMGRHLANQNQVICVRRERGQCMICWNAMNAIDFQVSNNVAGGINDPAKCCSYGSNGITQFGFDCVSIPGAEKNTAKNIPVANQFCGRSKGLVTGTKAKANKVICSRLEPFQIRFNSDTFENLDVFMAGAKKGMPKMPNEATAANSKGFNLVYMLSNANCN